MLFLALCCFDFTFIIGCRSLILPLEIVIIADSVTKADADFSSGIPSARDFAIVWLSIFVEFRTLGISSTFCGFRIFAVARRLNLVKSISSLDAFFDISGATVELKTFRLSNILFGFLCSSLALFAFVEFRII